VSGNLSYKNQIVIAEVLGATSVVQTTKAQILNSYLKIAVKEGTTALSLTRLAEDSGLSKQLIRYHVPDLDHAALELFRITAQTGARFTQDRLEKVHGSEKKMRAWVEATFDWVVAFPDFAKFLLFMYHRASVDDEVKDLHEKIMSTGRKRLLGVLSLSERKSIQRNAVFLTQILHQLMTAVLIEMLSLEDLKNHVKYRKEFHQAVEFILK
jgi:DNA-binding transcriptional regulator YbjK